MKNTVGPFQATLHSEPSGEGGADRYTNWDSPPDYDELAGACRFRDGRDGNSLGALTELYPYLAHMLSYCRAILLRRHICSFQIIPDDAGPVLNGPAISVLKR